MPNWELIRITFLKGDMKAENLERLQTMERWLYLPFQECVQAATKAFEKESEETFRPWFQLSSVLLT